MNKKTGKNILIIIAIIVISLVSAIAYIVIEDIKQENLLKKELINISNKDLITGNFDIEVKTTGDYAYIEEAVKKYYQKISNNVKVINSYFNNKDLLQILSADNIKNDGPEFINSYKILDEAKTNTEKSLEEISNLCSEEAIKNLINKKKVSDYSYDLYLDLMYTEEDLTAMKEVGNEMSELSTTLNTFFDKVKVMLDFLKNNASSWNIEEEQLYFNNSKLVNEYNALYQDLTNYVNDNFKNNYSNQDNKTSTSI